MGLKPMNCPAHIQIYKDARRSYRDLPVRYSEQGLVHRHEPSGALHGLLRVRHITQDDAHIFCTEEQVQEEVVQCLRFGFSPLRPVRLRAAAGALHSSAEADRQRGDVGSRRGGARGGLESEGLAVRAEPRRRRLLRTEDRPAHERLDRALLAAGDRAARLLDARALRPRLHRRRQRRAPARDDPPRAARLLRALHRHPDRALRRRAAAVARARAGDRAERLRALQRVRRPGARAAARAACAPSSTTAASPSGARSATPSCASPFMLVVGEREAGEGTVSVRARGAGDDGGAVAVEELVERLLRESDARVLASPVQRGP